MLEYEWGNPSSMLLSGEEEEPTQDSDQTRQILVDHYNQNLAAGISLFPSHQPNNNYHHHHDQSFHEQQQQQQQQQTSSPLQLYDPKIYSTNNVLSYPSPANPPTTFLPESMAQQVTSSNFMMMMPKNEDICGQRVPTTTTAAAASASIDFSTRIGLNLGGRTYFSSEDDFVNRFYRRSRHLEPGPANIPRCQAEGCNADLTHSKHYHRRHKVCEFHSKAATVLTAGITQRFCQQCSRFHLLTEFDQGKRSCRKRLADHNRRRRKSNPPPPPPSTQQQQQQSDQLRNTTTDQQNPTRSSPDSAGMHSSSSSVTVAAMSHMEGHSALRRLGGHN